MVYSFWSYKSWYTSDFFRLIFFDVGQGDSILIITPGGKTILIDGGPDNKVLRGLGDALPFWRRQIDLIVVTHAHDDHVAGLVEVSRRYHIENFLKNNLNFKTPALDSLLKVLEKNKIKIVTAETGMIFNFDNNCTLSVLAAAKDKQANENDYSVVTMFNCLGRKVLLSGDAGAAIEKQLLVGGENLKADIFKISHHGSLSANSLEFLNAVQPNVTVISVGATNTFGHPSPVILDRLQMLPVNMYRTDKQGTIQFLANDKLIRLNN